MEIITLFGGMILLFLSLAGASLIHTSIKAEAVFIIILLMIVGTVLGVEMILNSVQTF